MNGSPESTGAAQPSTQEKLQPTQGILHEKETFPARRGSWRACGLLPALLLAGLAGLALLLWPRGKDVEVAVLFSGTDDGQWLQFLQGLDLHGRQEKQVRATYPGGTVLFRWYPEVGESAMRARARKLCDRPEPPLAVVCPGNSTLAWAVVKEIKQRCGEMGREAPLLLFSGATSDSLLAVEPRGRRFRFAGSNSAQVQWVIEGLKAYYRKQFPQAGDPVPRPLRAFVVMVKGVPYSEDLAERFVKGLTEQLGKHLDGQPELVPLRHSAGSQPGPTDDEKQLIGRINHVLEGGAGQRVRVVLAITYSSVFRRVCPALKPRAAEDLVVLGGDTMSDDRWKDTDPVTIFYSHGPDSEPSIDERLGRALAEALARSSGPLDPEHLAAELAQDRWIDSSPGRLGECRLDVGGWVRREPGSKTRVESWARSP
jgi:hypothetical protein